MSIYERVQELIKQQGITVKQLERECELANATIRRWETQTPNIESVRKVAQRLNTTIDYLVTGSSPTTNDPRFTVYCDGVPLTESEADLVAMFRLLPEEHRKESFEFIHFKYSHFVVGGEKASIYSTYSDTKEQQKSDPDHGDKTKSGTA